MFGLMQDFPLTTNAILRRGEQYFGAKQVRTRRADGTLAQDTFADLAHEARLIAAGLDELGISPEGRVATFGWNTARHLALYLGIPGSGRVMHTANLRYFAEHLIYTINHAEDEAVFVDRSLLPLLSQYLPHLSTVRHVIVMDDGATAELPDDPRVRRYEDLLAGVEPIELDDRVRDERQAAALCYTTGTTGNPKGVLYSHRSTWLHSSATTTMSAFALAETDRVLPVVPMFHANAWGLGYAAFLAGAELVMPGPDLAPASLVSLMESERVTIAAGVPTIWMGLLDLLEGRDLSALRLVICGGSAVPRALSESWRERVGVPITQAWGMTELSPLGTICTLRSEYADATEEVKADLRASAGLAVPGVEVRIVDAETGAPLAWDGELSGELECRGPWVAAQYYRTDEPGEQFSPDGWLRTGDVATISPLGYVRLVDRTKDLVKSGGEWISSVALENELMAHPLVAEAAVIGVAHPRWVERPLACVVARPGESPTREELLEFLRARVASWQVPDDVVFVEEIPKTSVGKFSKKTLRDRFADYELPTV